MLYVLFATRNGAKTLPAFLNSLEEVLEPDGGCEIIAIDNASTDATRAILDRYCDRLPLTILSELIPGKCNALNSALDFLGRKAVHAELVVFTDDDVIVEPDWLVHLQMAAHTHPEASLFGGTVQLQMPCVIPASLYDYADQFALLFGERHGEDGPCTPELLHGTNLAIRGAAFANGIRFNPQFGPDGTRFFAASCDRDLILRLHRTGHRAVFAAEARLRHRIPAAHLSDSAMLEQAYCAGLGYGLRGEGQKERRGRRKSHHVPLSLKLGHALTETLGFAAHFVGREKWRHTFTSAKAWHAGAIEGTLLRLERENASGPRAAPLLAGPSLASIGGFM